MLYSIVLHTLKKIWTEFFSHFRDMLFWNFDFLNLKKRENISLFLDFSNFAFFYLQNKLAENAVNFQFGTTHE